MAITAKEYLSQLEELEKKVKHKKQQLAEAKRNRGIVTISNDSEVGKVQTSFSGGDGRRTLCGLPPGKGDLIREEILCDEH